jgi:6,7-dimethyl-8-ribityllumazine synthase
MPSYSGELRAAPDARYAIVASRWNPRIVDALVEGAWRVLREHGVVEEAIDLVRVPGAWEIPQVAAKLAAGSRAVSAILALGCVVRGDTRHYEHVADGCAEGLMRVALEHRLPVLNGVLAVERHADAEARAGGAHGNKGEEIALAALEMADLWKTFNDADGNVRFPTSASSRKDEP